MFYKNIDLKNQHELQKVQNPKNPKSEKTLKKLTLATALILAIFVIEANHNGIHAMDKETLHVPRPVLDPMKKYCLDDTPTGNILCYQNTKGQFVSLSSGGFNAVQDEMYGKEVIKLNAIDVVTILAGEPLAGDGRGTDSRQILDKLSGEQALSKPLFDHFIKALNLYIENLSKKLAYAFATGEILNVNRKEGLDMARFVLQRFEEKGYEDGKELLIRLLRLIGSGGSQQGWASLSQAITDKFGGTKAHYRAGLDWLKYATHTEVLMIGLVGHPLGSAKNQPILSLYQPCSSCQIAIRQLEALFRKLSFMRTDFKHTLPDYSIDNAPYKWFEVMSEIQVDAKKK